MKCARCNRESEDYCLVLKTVPLGVKLRKVDISEFPFKRVPICKECIIEIMEKKIRMDTETWPIK